MINRKKLVATAKRREGVYNRTVEPSVTFFEKGAAADKVKPYFKNKIRRTERLAVTWWRRGEYVLPCKTLLSDRTKTCSTRFAPLTDKTVHRTVLLNRSSLKEFNSLHSHKKITPKGVISLCVSTI